MVARQGSLALFSNEPGYALRPYQLECLAALDAFRRKGGKRCLVALPTGTGKTIIFSQLPKLFGGRVLVLAHREELLDQAAGKLTEANPDLSVAIEQAERSAPAGTDIVVASVQTLATNGRRLDALADGRFSAIVVDEAHHMIARSYLNILARFGLAPAVEDLTHSDLERRELSAAVRARFEHFKPDKTAPFLVGVTATPSRTDGRGLEWVLDELVFSRTIAEMMDEGWLAPIRGERVQSTADISDVTRRGGDFAEGELSEVVNSDERNELAVSAYKQYAAGRRALVFAVDVEHTYALRDAAHSAGIRAAAVVGETPRLERKATVDAYRRGDLDWLVNCMVLTEGFDAPETDCLIMARPTTSSLLYTQMIGRGSRVAPGKKDCLVIDIVDVAKVGVQSLNAMFGLPPRLKLSATDVRGAARAIEEMAGKVSLDKLLALTDLKDLPTLAQSFNPLQSAEPESWLALTLAWAKTGFGYVLGFPSGEQLGIVVNTLGHGELRLKPAQGKTIRIGYFHNVQGAVDAGEHWANTNQKESLHLVRKNAKWRKDRWPSDGQLRYAHVLGIRLEGEEKVLSKAYRAKRDALGHASLTREEQEEVQHRHPAYEGRSKGQMGEAIDAAQTRKGNGKKREEVFD